MIRNRIDSYSCPLLLTGFVQLVQLKRETKQTKKDLRDKRDCVCGVCMCVGVVENRNKDSERRKEGIRKGGEGNVKRDLGRNG